MLYENLLISQVLYCLIVVMRITSVWGSLWCWFWTRKTKYTSLERVNFFQIDSTSNISECATHLQVSTFVLCRSSFETFKTTFAHTVKLQIRAVTLLLYSKFLRTNIKQLVFKLQIIKLIGITICSYLIPFIHKQVLYFHLCQSFSSSPPKVQGHFRTTISIYKK